MSLADLENTEKVFMKQLSEMPNILSGFKIEQHYYGSIHEKKQLRRRRNLRLGKFIALEESKHETLPLSGAADSIHNGEQGGTSPTQARLKQ